MAQNHSIAAASRTAQPPAVRAPTAIAPNIAVKEAGRDSLSLPAWARNTECRLLLSLIEEERPERKRVLTRCLDGTAADFGYAGKNAARLRAIWEVTRVALREWSSAAPTRALFQARRDAVIAYHEEFGADALIARLLGDEA